MAQSSTLFSVDRQEGTFIVLIDDAGATFNVTRSDLPPVGIHEGAMLRVPRDQAGHFSWKESVVDATEEKARRQKAEVQIRKIGKADRGGDISL